MRDSAQFIDQVIANERAQWIQLVQVDDGTPAHWEDLVRRSVGKTADGIPFIPRWEATSAFTPSSHAGLYKLPADLAAEWLAYRDRWERFLDLNPRARIADMLSDCSESDSSMSFPHGWEHVVKEWALSGFQDPSPFYAHERIRSEAWKAKLLDAMSRAGEGWIYMTDDVILEWRR